MSNKDIIGIANQFKIQESIEDFHTITTGHINDSYLIRTNGDSPGYFLQWVNSYIFKDVEGLMRNIETVTRHIADKVNNGNRDGFRVLELVPSLEGKSYYKDSNGEFWRMYLNIPDTHVYDIVENKEIAFQGGKAFGRFVSDLADLPSQKLTETIPNFHNMETRILNFLNSVKKDPFGRRKEVSVEIDFVDERSEEMLRIPEWIKEGKIPMRITHNDTKFNNILFNEENKAICIVDLDTVMPGSVLFDFGDAIRTTANTACEDERDLSRVDLNLPIFEAYAKGFMSTTHQSLTNEEINLLAFSARYMTFIIGLRFLTDYIDGDPYFRTSYPTHNLDRTRVQFRLIEAMERNSLAMEKIIKDACLSLR